MADQTYVITKVKELNLKITKLQSKRDQLIDQYLRDHNITWEQFNELYRKGE